MLRLYIFLFLTIFSCSFGESDVSTTTSPVVIGGQIGEHKVFRNDVFGYSMLIPSSIMPELVFENPGSTPEVIKQRYLFRTHTGAHIVVDVWENTSDLSLEDWAIGYRPYAFYSDSGRFAKWKVGTQSKYNAIFSQSPRTSQSFAKDIVLIEAKPYVIRIMYVIMDEGKSSEIFRMMFESFSIGGERI